MEKRFKQGYSMVEAYVARHYGVKCRKLRWLIDHYDSIAALQETDFGRHVLVRPSTIVTSSFPLATCNLV